MNYDERLAEILNELHGINSRLDSIEAKLQPTPAPIEVTIPPTGGLFDFVSPTDDLYGFGSVMTSPDPVEAIRRACANVNWRGDVALSPEERDARWAIIERLKKADPELLPYYGMLDPGFCGLGLLTGTFEPHTSDALSFGTTKIRRESLVGKTVEAFLAENLGVSGTPGIA